MWGWRVGRDKGAEQREVERGGGGLLSNHRRVRDVVSLSWKVRGQGALGATVSLSTTGNRLASVCAGKCYHFLRIPGCRRAEDHQREANTPITENSLKNR